MRSVLEHSASCIISVERNDQIFELCFLVSKA